MKLPTATLLLTLCSATLAAGRLQSGGVAPAAVGEMVNIRQRGATGDGSTDDTSAVAKELPYGTVTVTAVKGGLKVDDERGGDAIIIANAAVIVSLEDGAPG